MNYAFAIFFGLWGLFSVYSIIRGLVIGVWPPWPLVLAPLAVLCLLFLVARSLFELGSMSASIIRSRTVSCWLSLAAPFAALALCYLCRLLPWGMPAAKIYVAWHLGFLGSSVLALIAMAAILARRDYRWIWMPVVGLGLTIPFALSTEHLMHIW
jgi:hypothetical protein